MIHTTAALSLGSGPPNRGAGRDTPPGVRTLPWLVRVAFEKVCTNALGSLVIGTSLRSRAPHEKREAKPHGKVKQSICRWWRRLPWGRRWLPRWRIWRRGVSRGRLAWGRFWPRRRSRNRPWPPGAYEAYGYGYGPYYGYGPSYAYYDGCLRTRRVWGPYGWRLQRINVCY
jgi:hypothetical protein